MNPVEVTQDLSIVSLVLHASLLVQFVMGLLLVMSLFSWTYIFRKAFALRAARSQTETFERDFWAGGDLQALYQSAANNRHKTGALERIFEAGMREYLKTREQQRGGGDPSAILDAARRAMRAAYQREMDSLESHLPFLASVGSVSPYIGLFGTVWGIMNAFRGLSNVQQATLSAVAPGIAEALVATAIGLFAAIPAVIAYNRYATELDRLANRFESFMEEFSNILQPTGQGRHQRRSVHRRDAGAAGHLHGGGARGEPRCGQPAVGGQRHTATDPAAHRRDYQGRRHDPCSHQDGLGCHRTEARQ